MRFNRYDRVMILAAHPDDEVLGCGGLIQQLVEAGSQIRIVYLTNGDYNAVSSMIYHKKPILRRSDLLRIGRMRRAEAVQAMTFLGVREEDLVFLGYPDAKLGRIWAHAGEKTFKSLAFGTNKVPYKGKTFGHTYKRENIVQDLREEINSFKPTAIYLPAPYDDNKDHQAVEAYLEAALGQEGYWTSFRPLWGYMVHTRRFLKKKKDMMLPDEGVFPLSALQVQRKMEAILKYKSQVAYNRHFLLSFVKTYESFYRLNPVVSSANPIEENTARLL